MEVPTTDSGSEREFSLEGVVLMKGHPRHPALHHHGLGELSVSSKQVKLFSYHRDEELAVSPAERVTLGTSHPEGVRLHQVLLSVDNIEAGIRYRQQFTDAVTALGGRYEDESTSFEHLIAKWPF